MNWLTTEVSGLLHYSRPLRFSESMTARWRLHSCGLFRLETYFVTSTVPNATCLKTKRAIVEYLDAQTAKIDAAIAAARREIELLREYRERLIADVVTGKVDVREVAARLPEEPPEEEGDPLTDESEETTETLSADEETED